MGRNSTDGKNLQLLSADKQVQTVFAPALFASFSSTRNLKKHLERTKIYLLERKVSFHKISVKKLELLNFTILAF